MQAFPFLYLNLGGELLFIVEQRLQAQNISAEKSRKVLNDILSTMLNRQFIGEMFRPGPLVGLPSFKALMEKVVHSSIMRLNPESLEKLYDLMLMAFKFQVFTIAEPSQILEVTLTHVDSWTDMTDDPEILLQIQYARSIVTQNCEMFTPWTWLNARHTLLNYLQPNKTRVTVFLRKELQSQKGGHFYLNLGRAIPEVIELPQSPLYLAKTNEKRQQEVIRLGSNMFNEGKKLRSCKMSTILDGLVGKPKKHDAHPAVESLDRCASPPLQWEPLQLELSTSTNQVQREASPHVEQETLLDLFDQAVLLDDL